MTMCTLLCITILGMCFGIGVVTLLKIQDRNTCCSAPYHTSNTRINVGSWEDCGNGLYKGTLNGEWWKTRNKEIAEAMINVFGSKEFTTVTEVFNNYAKINLARKRNTQDIVKDYDKLLEKIGEM